MSFRRSFSRPLLAAGLLLLSASIGLAAPEWESTVSPFQPGSFPELRPVRVQYAFGWNEIMAATADVRYSRKGDRMIFEVTGGTTGLAKKLWSYKARHSASADAQTLRPLQVREEETVRGKQMTTDLTFTPEGVTSQRDERRGATAKSKTRRFDFPNVLSLNSALLLLRSQSLNAGAVHRIVVYPATSAYLCTVTVLGRESITVPAGTYEAIKLDLQLEKIGKQRELQPHKKFRKATVWLSDDADRLVLRIETQVFIGTVFAELQSVQFENAKP